MDSRGVWRLIIYALQNVNFSLNINQYAYLISRAIILRTPVGQSTPWTSQIAGQVLNVTKMYRHLVERESSRLTRNLVACDEHQICKTPKGISVAALREIGCMDWRKR